MISGMWHLIASCTAMTPVPGSINPLLARCRYQYSRLLEARRSVREEEAVTSRNVVDGGYRMVRRQPSEPCI